MMYTHFGAEVLSRPLCAHAEYLDSSDDAFLPVSGKRYCQNLVLCYKYRMLLPQWYSFLDLVLSAESITDRAKGYREGVGVRQSADIEGLALNQMA